MFHLMQGLRVFVGFGHLAGGLAVGLSSLAAGLAIGIVGDAGRSFLFFPKVPCYCGPR